MLVIGWGEETVLRGHIIRSWFFRAPQMVGEMRMPPSICAFHWILVSQTVIWSVRLYFWKTTKQNQNSKQNWSQEGSCVFRMVRMTWWEVRGELVFSDEQWHQMQWGGTRYLTLELSWFSLLLSLSSYPSSRFSFCVAPLIYTPLYQDG